jgi:hypothetical protein
MSDEDVFIEETLIFTYDGKRAQSSSPALPK